MWLLFLGLSLLNFLIFADDFDFLESEEIQKEMNSVGKKLENISEAKKTGVKANLTKKDCKNLLLHERSFMKKDVYRFVTGTPLTSSDLDGDFIQGAVGDEKSRWAKMGLPRKTTYRAGTINQKWAVHADPRCGPYFSVEKIDYFNYKKERCRRAYLSLDKIKYRVFFCENNNKGYVDHFGIL